PCSRSLRTGEAGWGPSPRSRLLRTGESGSGGRPFWQRWRLAWRIKRSRFNYDLHRASGLWVWAMLFVLAWSSVAFNLNTEVYQPVMRLVFDMRAPDDLPTLDKPLEVPALGWREAYAQGQRLMTEAGAHYGFTVLSEQSLFLDREHGVYHYLVLSSEDLGKNGGTRVLFDANTGALKALITPNTEASGQVITRWLTWLHTARVFGLPMQIFVCAMGLIITALSVTGVVIWLRKRRSPRRQRERRAHNAPARSPSFVDQL
ncbi:MAG: PepSY-associated TM helix domain-containing protein, partial [Gammaproteobacteria bacterium]